MFGSSASSAAGILVLSVSLLCGLANFSAAQGTPPLSKGAHVRIVVPASNGASEQRLSGNLLRLQNDTVVIQPGWSAPAWAGSAAAQALPESLSMALDEGRRLELLQSSHPHPVKGAALGALFGGLAGGIVGSGSWSPSPCTGTGWFTYCIPGTQGENAAVGAILGAAGGALVGLVIGSLIRSETWVPVQTTGIH